jgi:hypothetical protein
VSGDSSEAEGVDKCTVTFSIDPATGILQVAESKGKLLRDIRSGKWFWLKLIALVVAIVSLFVGFKVYTGMR